MTKVDKLTLTLMLLSMQIMTKVDKFSNTNATEHAMKNVHDCSFTHVKL